MPKPNPVLICSKAGDCQQLATHVLIYVNKKTLLPIWDKPKHYCRHHAYYMQVVMKTSEDIQARVYTVDEYMRIVSPQREERDRSDRK